MSATKFAGLAFALLSIFGGAAQVAEAQQGNRRIVLLKNGALRQGMPRMKNGAYYAVYKFYGHQGRTYRVAANSKQFDTYLWVQGVKQISARNAIVLNDDHNGTNSLVSMRCTRSGYFYVVVTSYRGGETGNYGLAVVEFQ